MISTSQKPVSSSFFPRLLTALVLITAIGALLHFATTQLIFGFVLLVFGIAHRELLRLNPEIRAQKSNFFTAYYALAAWLFYPHFAPVLCGLLAWVLLAPLIVWNPGADKAKNILTQSYHIFALMYFALPLWGILQILALSNYKFLLYLGIGITAFGDSFAYFGGRLFGKRKLAPNISPNKTQEGAFCALIGGILAALIIHLIFKQNVPLWQQVILGISVAIVGILGDLSESALKRAFGVKDSGNLLPGHGGVFDRIDAYLFTLPCLWLYGLWIAP